MNFSEYWEQYEEMYKQLNVSEEAARRIWGDAVVAFESGVLKELENYKSTNRATHDTGQPKKIPFKADVEVEILQSVPDTLTPEEAINVEELLMKYIHFIRDCEGIDFIDNYPTYVTDVVFSDAEIARLKELSDINGEATE